MNSVDRSRRLRQLCLAGTALLGAVSAVRAQDGSLVEDNPPPAPRAEIVKPDTPPPKAEIVDENEAADPAPEVRPAPKTPARAKTPEDDLFDYSDLLFGKKDYSLAIRQYEEYLKVFPNGKYREEARFKIGVSQYRNQALEVALLEFDSYLRDFPSGRNRAIVFYYAGECHRILADRETIPEKRISRKAVSEDAYRAVLQTTTTGPYAAYAAFRLAILSYNDAAENSSKYRDAIKWFTIAAAQMPKEQASIRYAALFFKGRSCKYTGSLKEAAAAFEAVILSKEGNDYYEKALMELATMDMEAGRQDAAMKKFEQLARESAAAETRAESMVNAGMIHADAGRTDEAVAQFEAAAKVAGAPMASARARYGLVFAYYKQQSWQKVIDAWRGIGDYTALDPANRARLFLIVGACYASLDQHARAAAVFGNLEEAMPDREEALEAGYKRLVSLFKANDPGVPEDANNYVERWRERFPKSNYLDKAWLVRAAYYYNRSIWEQAAKAYQRVREDKLEPEKLATYLSQRGCAETSHGDKEAATTLSRFLTKFPEDDRVPMATLQRGLAEMTMSDYAGAQRDFQTVRDQYPKSEGAESAAFRLAQVKGMAQDYPGMVTEFQRLLKDYPDTKVAAEAWFWIGTGLFRQQKVKDCVEPLRTAREKDGKAYYTDATLMIIGALAAQREIDPLMAEVDGYQKGSQEKKISPEILSWLGRTVFAERQDYRAASRYLSPIVNYDDPRSTPRELWSTLGESQLENGSWESALVALDHQLATEDRPAAKVKALLLKGQAYLALNRLEEATASAEAGLDIDKETLLSARLRILIGDIAMTSSRPNEAISSYGMVMQNWVDGKVTPLAMWKLIQAYEKSGTAAHRAEAAKIKKELERRFPRFTAPEPNG